MVENDVKNGSSEQVSFQSVVDRLVNEMVGQMEQPSVKNEVIEKVGLQMVRCGYKMSPWAVNVLADYLRGYNLWLCGRPGAGKTFFFDCMSAVRKSMGYDRIAKLSMIETQSWTMDSAKEWADENEDRDVLIDDVGTEPEEMVSYGQRVDLFQYLLEKRMQLRRRTHLTSNLGAKDITRRYGLRVADRFVQMFKMHIYPESVDGKKTSSRRTLSPWRTAKSGNGVI